VLKPTEVHLLKFCAKLSSSTSIPCLRQYFAVGGNLGHTLQNPANTKPFSLKR